MTQPIQEPLTQRSISSLQWGQNQLYRRPDPGLGSGSGTCACYYTDFSWTNDGNTIDNNNWRPVVTGVAPDSGTTERWFNEFCADPACEFGRDFDAGTITFAGNAYAFSAWGFCSFDVPNGTLIGAAIDWFGAENMANTSTVVDNVRGVIAYAERVPLPVGGVSLLCYQASGGDAELLEARLHVRRFELFEDVWECETPFD